MYVTLVRTATASGNIQQSCLSHLLQVTGRKFRQFIVLAHLVGQAGIGI